MKKESIWSDEMKWKNKEKLNSDLTADVVVIGAGLAGILTAWQLQEAGKKVVVVEAEHAGGGITKNTTAKITSQHNLIYDKLIRQFGEEKAGQYAQSNQQAVKNYKNIIDRYGIECHCETQPSYVYTLSDTENVEKEAEAARRLGIDSCFTTETDLPFSIKGAVRFEDQLQFQPLEFLQYLASCLTVYEQSKAVEITKDNQVRVVIHDNRDEIRTVQAEDIVVATHYPFINTSGYYFLRMHQERSYVIAVEGNETLSYGMYIDSDKDGFSLRRYGNRILIGGGNHRTGKNKSGGRYDKLLEAAAKWYPDYPVTHQWSNQDCMTIDHVPFIGRYSHRLPHVYVATGFGKWGMSTSMVSALLIRDMICGQTKDTGIYTPARFPVAASARTLGEEIATVARQLTLTAVAIPPRLTEDLPSEKGTIVRYQGKKWGVYKELSGKIFAVSTTCPHLGCMLAWNEDEKTWDCPCHGSRFDYKGNLIDNPSLSFQSSCPISIPGTNQEKN